MRALMMTNHRSYTMNQNKKYRATYRDPIDGSVTHYWEFTDNNLRQAQKRAKNGILQRNDGYVDVLDKVEELTQ
jgi:hypothetical protein